ncbi:MAG TPA: restriction endonuclease [Terriglobales bacterium]|nr:restriction endonuclease [Terriglobales bacterium]
MPSHRQNRETGFVNLLAKALQKAGWHVKQPPESADSGADIVARHGKKIYVFELKASSEARKDRAIPLISQAILEAQRAAGQVSDRAIPVAVLASAHISDSLAGDIKDFSLRNAPGVGVGVIDAGGFRRFTGHGLEAVNAERSHVIETTRKEVSPGNLFSDLSQWMLKILLSRSIPDSLLSAPRGHYENASQLAEAAGVSVMSAFRLVRQLSEEGFLEERSGLRLVRTEELLERWLRASHYRAQETPARWILSGERNRFHAALRSYASRTSSDHLGSKSAGRVPPRLCLGLFAAAEVLGFAFVHGVQPYLYTERIDQEVLRELGLSLELAGREADVFVRVPKYPESVFRAAVEHDGVPASDILQVWLDVSNHPARGKDQANLLRKRVLSQIVDRARA